MGRMALDYRYAISTPVVVDLIGFRRTGTAKWTIRPSRSRCATGKSRRIRRYGRFTPEKIGVDAAPIVERVRHGTRCSAKRG